jgi:glycosyltransferase involved in cell wall biosynthesis
MRVMIAVPWDQDRGGVASVVGQLGRFLAGRGHRVVFLFPGTNGSPERVTTTWGFDGYRVAFGTPWESAGSLRGTVSFWIRLPLVVAQLVRILRRERIQILNVHYPLDLFTPLAVCRWLRAIKLVASLHGADLFPEGRALLRRHQGLRTLLRAADRVVAPSHAFLAECLAEVPQLARRGVAIHNGLDPEEFAGFEPVAATARPADRILCIAALRRKKGHDVLLRAFADLGGESVHLEFVGSGPEEPALQGLARELGVATRVEFRGFLDRAATLHSLAAADIVVLPSRHEPFGIAAIEGMMAGRPVVAAAVGGLTEIITDGQDGVLVPPDDPAALAAALRRLLDDANLRARLGAAGRQTVLRRFTRDHMGAAYEEQFATLLGGAVR